MTPRITMSGTGGAAAGVDECRGLGTGMSGKWTPSQIEKLVFIAQNHRSRFKSITAKYRHARILSRKAAEYRDERAA